MVEAISVPHRARIPTAERRARIVEAARRCFAVRGFAGTTTRMLARAAGVSEALIFRHFPTKRSLYRAIIARQIREPGEERLFPRDAAERGDDRAVLSSIADGFVHRVESDPTFMRLLLYSALEGAPLAAMFFRARLPFRRFLISYLERRMREGALRPAHPRLAAGAFLGMIFHTMQVKYLFRIDVPRIPREELVRTWVDIFLKGLRR